MNGNKHCDKNVYIYERDDRTCTSSASKSLILSLNAMISVGHLHTYKSHTSHTYTQTSEDLVITIIVLIFIIITEHNPSLFPLPSPSRTTSSSGAVVQICIYIYMCVCMRRRHVHECKVERVEEEYNVLPLVVTQLDCLEATIWHDSFGLEVRRGLLNLQRHGFFSLCCVLSYIYIYDVCCLSLRCRSKRRERVDA